MKKDQKSFKKDVRFSFGANWACFLKLLSGERIQVAENSLKRMLGVEDLKGKTFLDIGSGSGLFSLAARRLGAKVHSFDCDPQSVACTTELRNRFFPEDIDWCVEQGSVLNQDYLGQLGQFDVVYSWGVLHHTGRMWDALGNVAPLIAPKGMLFIAIYNDQGWISKYWLFVKKNYNKSKTAKNFLYAIHFPYLIALRWIRRKILNRRSLERGMDYQRDMHDWLGGYPFEVATPEIIVEYYTKLKFQIVQIKTSGRRLGCNEFVFEKK